MTPQFFGGQEFFLKGKDPRILLISGTHGNETGVIDSLKTSILKYRHLLPDFMFIPEFSPSAVAQGTRHNQNGANLNRNFSVKSQDPEIRRHIEILSRYYFDYCFSFHEDPQLTQFYLYDSHTLDNIHLAKLRQAIIKTGTTLYSGIDDPADPHLNSYIDQGYAPYDLTPTSFDHWAVDKGIVNRSLVIEIPGLASSSKKDHLVDIIFEELIIKLIQTNTADTVTDISTLAYQLSY